MNAPQYQRAGFAPRDDPPVDLLAFDHRTRASEFPTLASHPADQGPHPPREGEAVPAVAPADPIEIGVQARGRLLRERQGYAYRVNTVAESAAKAQDLSIQGVRLAVQRGRQGVIETDRFDAECSVGARPIMDDDLRDKTLHKGVADSAIDRRDEIQPVRGESGSQEGHVDDQPRAKAACLGERGDHLPIGGDLSTADLVDAGIDID